VCGPADDDDADDDVTVTLSSCYYIDNMLPVPSVVDGGPSYIVDMLVISSPPRGQCLSFSSRPLTKHQLLQADNYMPS